MGDHLFHSLCDVRRSGRSFGVQGVRDGPLPRSLARVLLAKDRVRQQIPRSNR